MGSNYLENRHSLEHLELAKIGLPAPDTHMHTCKASRHPGPPAQQSGLGKKLLGVELGVGLVELPRPNGLNRRTKDPRGLDGAHKSFTLTRVLGPCLTYVPLKCRNHICSRFIKAWVSTI